MTRSARNGEHRKPPQKTKRRKAIPISVKLTVAMRCLRKLLKADRLEFDHRPALWEREWDEEAQDTIPPANDPAFIELVTGEEHDRRSHGNGATSYGSDAHNRAKEDRITGKTKAAPKKPIPSRPFAEKPEGYKTQWPSQKIQSRPMRREEGR